MYGHPYAFHITSNKEVLERAEALGWQNTFGDSANPRNSSRSLDACVSAALGFLEEYGITVVFHDRFREPYPAEGQYA